MLFISNLIAKGGYCRGPRTEEGIVELLSLFLRHHKPEEGIHLRMGGEETRDFWDVRTRRRGVERESWKVGEVSSESYPTASALKDWQQLYQVH